MRSTAVHFFSEGERIAGLWRVADDSHAPVRAIVHGPGWMGLADAALYSRYHEALTAAGFGVLVFDYRGFGESGGPPGISLRGQLVDLRNAVAYLGTREDVAPGLVGAFGSGGTGGGNAILLASVEPRIGAVVSQVPVSDGADWLRRMRSESEWIAFLARLEEDRRRRVLTGSGSLVAPREEIVLPTSERRTTSIKADVDGRVPERVPLAAAEEILEYCPIEAASGLDTPTMVIAVENDATTPTDHARALYEALAGSRCFVLQKNTTHYAAYDRYWTAVTPLIVRWFEVHLRDDGSRVRLRNWPDEPVEGVEVIYA